MRILVTRNEMMLVTAKIRAAKLDVRTGRAPEQPDKAHVIISNTLREQEASMRIHFSYVVPVSLEGRKRVFKGLIDICISLSFEFVRMHVSTV
jgi:hypothetical protein